MPQGQGTYGSKVGRPPKTGQIKSGSKKSATKRKKY